MASSTPSASKDVWSHILESLSYKGETSFLVTADQLKACKKGWTGSDSQFEPRLLCYQTSAEARPAVFKAQGLYILPVKNGTYRLGKTNVYERLNYASETEPAAITRCAGSLMLALGESETSLLDNLRYAGVFDTVLGEPILYGPLLNGRHRINMTMRLGEDPIAIEGVQYETDSCFESATKILILEGKSSAKPIDSFNIRQLYFPYREAMRVAAGKKEVVCAFVHELKGVIHLWTYTFAEVDRMDSITLTGHHIYRFP